PFVRVGVLVARARVEFERPKERLLRLFGLRRLFLLAQAEEPSARLRFRLSSCEHERVGSRGFFSEVAVDPLAKLTILLFLPLPGAARKVEVPVLRLGRRLFPRFFGAARAFVHCHQSITAPTIRRPNLPGRTLQSIDLPSARWPTPSIPRTSACLSFQGRLAGRLQQP